MAEKNMTALVSCFARAYHSKNFDHKIFDDYIAENILSKEEYESISKNMTDGILFFNPNFQGTKEEALKFIVNNQLSPSVLGRSAFAEKSLERDISLGLKQYLIFASGYDTYAYRNNDIEVFEMDKEEMINDKIRRLENADIDYSKTNFISIDFIDESWLDNLVNSKYNRNLKTFCSLLGISYYLKQGDFYRILNDISSVLCKGSTIVFDYPIFEESAKEKINQQLAKGANEEMKSKYSLQELEQKLQEFDLLIYENLTDKDMTEQYFKEYNLNNKDYQMKAPSGVNYCLAVKK
ncbi:MAG: class I SAM-dependent methyltransferase [Clostridia bacterium]|nr:class I SAM-dependent methyltransferase [Clostridia bacterium]